MCLIPLAFCVAEPEFGHVQRRIKKGHQHRCPCETRPRIVTIGLDTWHWSPCISMTDVKSVTYFLHVLPLTSEIRFLILWLTCVNIGMQIMVNILKLLKSYPFGNTCPCLVTWDSYIYFSFHHSNVFIDKSLRVLYSPLACIKIACYIICSSLIPKHNHLSEKMQTHWTCRLCWIAGDFTISPSIMLLKSSTQYSLCMALPLLLINSQ